MKAASPLLCALLAGLLGTLGCGPNPNYDEPPLLYNRRGETVALGLDAGDLQRAEASLEAGEGAELAGLLKDGRLFIVPNGTGVTVLERRSSTSKVRIRKDGREGYVLNIYIK